MHLQPRFILLLLLCLVACNQEAPASRVKPPNIVFILADDLDADAVSTMTQVQTRIGDQGLRFERNFVSLSLCCPSRISGLRSQFAHNTGIFVNTGPDGGFPGIYAKGLEESTFAVWLHKAGYRTGLFGKYLNGYPDTAPVTLYIPPGWDEWVSPIKGPFYTQYNYTLNDNGQEVAHAETEADYFTDVLRTKVQAFLTRSVREHPRQPFLAYVAPVSPHGPSTPAPRHANTYPGVSCPRPPSFNEADVSDKPKWVQDLPLLGKHEINDLDRRYRSRLQSLLALDELVGAVLDTLQTLGQLENTYIVFTSDNGYHLGLHRMDSGKASAYEEDLRVPLLVRGPGVPKKGQVMQLTSNVDHAATMAEIAGVAPPDWIDGRSLLTLMHGKTPARWRQALLLESRWAPPDVSVQALNGKLEPPEPDQIKAQASSKDLSFNGLRLANDQVYVAYTNGEYEFYDLSSDPYQLDNAYAKTTATSQTRWASWLTQLRAASGANLRLLEETPP